MVAQKKIILVDIVMYNCVCVDVWEQDQTQADVDKMTNDLSIN